ncbi:hypothetical protein D1627_16885 [Pontibacter oryzae]|uniref:Uncharacterized protein n=1 Tax=Pontibacter oryzae TaxID=2304593 RepID=A0A399RW31_9BACT|nr:hypothetical protein D1627_16885 [Pontibacter oryzae]
MDAKVKRHADKCKSKTSKIYFIYTLKLNTALAEPKYGLRVLALGRERVARPISWKYKVIKHKRRLFSNLCKLFGLLWHGLTSQKFKPILEEYL